MTDKIEQLKIITYGEQLLAAVKKGKFDKVKTILDDHYNVVAGVTDGEGNTALHLAVASKIGHQVEIIAELSKKGFMLTALNKQKQTPLHVAIAAGNVAAVKLLLKHCDDSFFAQNHNAFTLGAELYNKGDKFLKKDYDFINAAIFAAQEKLVSERRLKEAEDKTKRYDSRAKAAVSLALLSLLGIVVGLALLPIWPITVPVIGASLLGGAIALSCSAALWLGATAYGIYAQRVAKQARDSAIDLHTQLKKQITDEQVQANHQAKNQAVHGAGASQVPAKPQTLKDLAQAVLDKSKNSIPAGKVFTAAPPARQADRKPGTDANPQQ